MDLAASVRRIVIYYVVDNRGRGDATLLNISARRRKHARRTRGRDFFSFPHACHAIRWIRAAFIRRAERMPRIYALITRALARGVSTGTPGAGLHPGKIREAEN